MKTGIMVQAKRALSGFLMLGVFLCLFSVSAVQADPAPADVAGHETVAHEDAHADDHGKGGLPQFNPSSFPSQIFWLAVTFIVMYTVFSTRTLPAISGILENRQQHIASDLDMAEKLRAEAEAAQHAYEQLITSSRTEATRLINEADSSVKLALDKSLSDLQDKAVADIAALDSRLQSEKQAVMKDMNAMVAEIATDAARKLAGIEADAQQAQSVVKSLNDSLIKGREAA